MSVEVAETILQQLGGNRFIAMSGARYFVGDGNALQFRLPSNFAKGSINAVRITLTVDDTYDVVFSNFRDLALTEIATATGIFADQLRDVFRSETGLDTTL